MFVAQGAWKLEHLAMGRCHIFFPFLLVWLYLLRKSAYRDFFTYHLKSTHNKQQAGIIIICTEERGKKVMTGHKKYIQFSGNMV